MGSAACKTLRSKIEQASISVIRSCCEQLSLCIKDHAVDAKVVPSTTRDKIRRHMTCQSQGSQAPKVCIGLFWFHRVGIDHYGLISSAGGDKDRYFGRLK